MDKHVNRFYTTLNDFLFELEENFPNIKEQIQKYSIKIDFKEKNDKIKFILLCYKNLKEYNDFVKDSNGKLFESESEIYLLPEINFKKIWNVKYKNDVDKEKIWNSIWNFLKILYIIADLIHSLASKDVNNKNEVNMNDIITNLQNNKSNNAKIDLGQLGDAQEAVQNMFSGDNVMNELIGDITSEVSTELNGLDNTNIFELLGKNSDKLQNIIGNVSKTIDEKVSSGKLKEKDLLKSAKSMENVVNKNNPLMDMVKNLQNNQDGSPDLSQMMNMLNNLNPDLK
jgi:hypothetical protein